MHCGPGQQQDQDFCAYRQAFRQLQPLTLLGAAGPLRQVLVFIDHDAPGLRRWERRGAGGPHPRSQSQACFSHAIGLLAAVER
jgi:hypothetical protein